MHAISRRSRAAPAESMYIVWRALNESQKVSLSGDAAMILAAHANDVLLGADVEDLHRRHISTEG